MKFYYHHVRTDVDYQPNAKDLIVELFTQAFEEGQISAYAPVSRKPRKKMIAFPVAATVCEVVEGDMKARGYAFCSTRDHFSKKRGRMVARGRALCALGEQQEQRMLPRADLSLPVR